MKNRNAPFACLLALCFVGFGLSAESALQKTVKGSPKLQSIQVITFAPDGTLLIGDGRGSQVIAVRPPKTAAEPFTGEVANLNEKLAAKMGTTAKNVTTLDVAVQPTTGVAYLAVNNQNSRKPALLTISGKGKIGLCALEDVSYARLPLPKTNKVSINQVTAMACAKDRVLVAGRANELFASKIVSIDLPLKHEETASVYSAETYHVSHGRWETRAPMSSLMPYVENGKTFVAGAFSCTPVVKYPLEGLKAGDKIKGTSMIELGSGNRPLDMITYTKGKKAYVLMNTFRFHHQRKPFGPSPYWTVRFERDLLGGNEKVNKGAVRRVDRKYKPVTDRIRMIEAYHGVVHMARQGTDKAVVMREADKGSFNLTVLPLP